MAQLNYTNSLPDTPGRYRYRAHTLGAKYNLFVLVYDEMGLLNGIFIDKDGCFIGQMPLSQVTNKGEWMRLGGIL